MVPHFWWYCWYVVDHWMPRILLGPTKVQAVPMAMLKSHLVMTNSSPYRWPIEIDASPFLKMVDLSMAITRWYAIFSERSPDPKKLWKSKKDLFRSTTGGATTRLPAGADR